MKLSNSNLASVPESKITQYLLNPAHPAGGSKAAFFLRFGFTVSQWKHLAAALIQHACENEVAEEQDSRYGTRYVVDGLLTAPDGMRLNIRCVWFMDHGMDIPRFVTAYPLPK